MKRSLLLISLFMLFMPLYTEAETSGKMGRDEAFSFLRGAFEAQTSLGEELRTREEVDAILDPYFTDGYKKLFLDANLVEENGKYVTYGTDFGQYYIPYYGFSETTQVVTAKNKAYVFEYFPESSEGPVGYDSHYEGLLLEKSAEGWKVSKYLYDEIPESVIAQSEAPASEMESSGMSLSDLGGEDKAVEAASIHFQLGVNPIGGLFQYAAFIGEEEGGAGHTLVKLDENEDSIEGVSIKPAMPPIFY